MWESEVRRPGWDGGDGDGGVIGPRVVRAGRHEEEEYAQKDKE